MKISSQFPTSLDSPQHIEVAESLGYDRAWLYDVPQQSPDVWMMLALAAERTERIGLGPGVADWARASSPPPCGIRWSTPRARRHCRAWHPDEWPSPSVPASPAPGP